MIHRHTLRAATSRVASLFAVACCALLVAACGGGDDMGGMEGMEMGGAEGERQEFAFTGTIQTIDPETGIAAVAGAEVPGWMMAMTMNYYLEPAGVVESLEPGDEITAKVYSGDFQHLYEVEVVAEP